MYYATITYNLSKKDLDRFVAIGVYPSEESIDEVLNEFKKKYYNVECNMERL